MQIKKSGVYVALILYQREITVQTKSEQILPKMMEESQGFKCPKTNID